MSHRAKNRAQRGAFLAVLLLGLPAAVLACSRPTPQPTAPSVGPGPHVTDVPPSDSYPSYPPLHDPYPDAGEPAVDIDATAAVTATDAITPTDAP